jgi:hypothetical protein
MPNKSFKKKKKLINGFFTLSKQSIWTYFLKNGFIHLNAKTST